MTIPEAVHLVLEASAKGKAGETLILDMGEPVKIYDLAQKLIARSGKNVEIEFTGLRPGEKMDEELIKEDEVLHRSGSGLIRISN
jgi:dTDP-glucose 4,6-dehydratase